MPKTFPRRVGLGFRLRVMISFGLLLLDEASARRISIRGARGGEVNARASTRDGRYRPVIRR
jgi:hypothetical protein